MLIVDVYVMFLQSKKQLYVQTEDVIFSFLYGHLSKTFSIQPPYLGIANKELKLFYWVFLYSLDICFYGFLMLLIKKFGSDLMNPLQAIIILLSST